MVLKLVGSDGWCWEYGVELEGWWPGTGHDFGEGIWNVSFPSKTLMSWFLRRFIYLWIWSRKRLLCYRWAIWSGKVSKQRFSSRSQIQWARGYRCVPLQVSWTVSYDMSGW